MKKLLFGLVLLVSNGVQAAESQAPQDQKAGQGQEKIVKLILSDGKTEIQLSSSLAKAFTLLGNMLEDLGDSDEAIPVNNQFVTQETLRQLTYLNSSEVGSVEEVLAIINQYSLEQLVKLFLANNFLESSKVFTMMQNSAATKQLTDILFERITEELISIVFLTQDHLVALGLLDSHRDISRDFKIELYKRAPWDLLKKLAAHNTHGVASVVFSPDGTQIATASADTTAKLWDIQTGQLLLTLTEPTGWINSVAFSPNGQLIATGSSNNTAKLWNVQTGELLHILQGHNGMVTSVAFSPDGLMVATGSGDRTAKLWNTLTGQLLQTLEGRISLVLSVAFSPDGTQIVTGSNNGALKLWNVQTGECLRTLQGQQSLSASVGFSPDGQSIVVGPIGKTMNLWNLKTGKLFDTVQVYDSSILSAGRLSPNGSMIAVGGINGDITILVNRLAAKGVNLQTALGLSLPDLLSILKTSRTLEDLENIRKIEALLNAESSASDSLKQVEQSQIAGSAETRPEEPPAKRRKKESDNPFGRHAHPGRSQVDSEDSLSDEGEDEEFFCKFCSERFYTKIKLKKHENECDKRAPTYNKDDWF